MFINEQIITLWGFLTIILFCSWLYKATARQLISSIVFVCAIGAVVQFILAG
jgi:hypothetical protein